ncbi:hypothetical protein CY35_13G108300 [Sphagnum magellanicum]|nr:hypothetical protein CY35_13G108300 [Sphagnum magellanicum]
MDQEPIEIITVSDRNSAEIEEPAGAAVGEVFNAHEGSQEAHSGSEPQNLNHTSDAQEVQAGESAMTGVERRIRTLAKLKGLEPKENNLWKVAFEYFSQSHTKLQNLLYKTEETTRSVKNEICQVVGFFSAFQGLLITAAAQSTLLRCNDVAVILVLSAFATVAATFGILLKITAMEKLRSTSSRDRHYKKEVVQWLADLEASGINFHF